jgi:alpha-beta hydrolase superfamily lysophospholipase
MNPGHDPAAAGKRYPATRFLHRLTDGSRTGDDRDEGFDSPMYETLLSTWSAASIEAVADFLGPHVVRGAVAVVGFTLGAFACLILAVAEWGAWMLVAPGRRLGAGRPGPEPGPGEPIEARTADGLRHAGVWYPSTKGSARGRTALVIHGYAEDPLGFRDRAEALARRGWDAAAIDLRGHGQSEGEHTSFGGRESDDLRAWIGVLSDRVGPEMRLAVWGRSMGAAVALRAAAEDTRIAALVLESPYHDLESAIAVMIRRFRLPGPRLLARLISRRAEALAGVSLTRPRPLDLAPRVTVPTLIVHGSNDSLVAPADAQRLADAFPEPAPLIEVVGARHIDIVDVGGSALLDRIAAFLDASFAE